MKQWICLPLGLLISAFSGCMGAKTIQAMRLHTLDPVLHVAEFPASEKTLGVRPLHAARPYETAMAVVGEDKLLHFRQLDAWSETPDDFVTRALVDALAATHRFGDAGYAADMSRPDLILTGEIRKFHENQAVTPHVAELEIRVEVREARQKRNLWDGLIAKRVPLAADTTDAFAEAMEVAVAQAAQEAAEAIARAIP